MNPSLLLFIVGKTKDKRQKKTPTAINSIRQAISLELIIPYNRKHGCGKIVILNPVIWVVFK